MGTGIDGGLFKLLLLLHIMTAILGFGAVAFNGLYRARARQRGGDAEMALLEENGYITRIAEYLIYAVFVFGILAAATSKSAYQFKDAWLSAAMGLYIVDIGVLHGVIHRSEKLYKTLLGQVNSTASSARSAATGQLEQLEQRIRLGWAGFDVIFLIILFLMVFKPG